MHFWMGCAMQGDPLADEAVARLIADGGSEAVGAIFKMLQANDTPLPADAPKPLKDFMAAAAGLPPDIDRRRLPRGGDAFLRNALPSVVVLLASSLPRGYARPLPERDPVDLAATSSGTPTIG